MCVLTRVRSQSRQPILCSTLAAAAAAMVVLLFSRRLFFSFKKELKIRDF